MTSGTTHVPTGNTYDKYGSTNGVEQRMMRGFLRTLDGMLDGMSPRRVLEVGFGTGMVLFRIAPGCELYHGIDLSAAALARVKTEADVFCAPWWIATGSNVTIR